ncbi:MAG: flagellar basal body protein, partial [Bryobacteraceae bacterium]
MTAPRLATMPRVPSSDPRVPAWWPHMGNLLTSLFNSAGALQAFQNGLDTTQNNVSNSSTPGYAKQIPVMDATAFDLSIG